MITLSEDKPPVIKIAPGNRLTKPATDEPPPPEKLATSLSPAPIVHIADSKGALLVDYSFGFGKV
jgi:hypothetical protein